jgi:hypothetical protein
VLSTTKPLGRFAFIVQVSLLNTVILLGALIALTFQPSGGGHLAVLIVVGALQYVWFVLHGRRFGDAGRGLFWPGLFGLSCFITFALGYLLIAALWSSPEVQAEAFRTGGGLAAGTVRHIETNPLVIESGRVITSFFGTAGALVLSGLAITAMGLMAFISGGFSLIAFVLPGGRAREKRLEAPIVSMTEPRITSTVQAKAASLVERWAPKKP